MESEWIPGAVFVALRDIEEGEEIFYDYEWEHNINFIQYSQRGDILIDWPWYQTVPQETVDVLIEPWLSYRDFLGETKKDWRLKKTDTISINPAKETLPIDSSEKDEPLLLEMSENEPKGLKDRFLNSNFYQGIFGGGFTANGGWGMGDGKSGKWGYVDDNVEPIPKPKIERKERRRPKLIKKGDDEKDKVETKENYKDVDNISVEDEEEVKLTSKKRRKIAAK